MVILAWCAIPGERYATLIGYLVLGFASRIILSIKVKVLGGGFGLCLGDNIAILSMVKR